MANLVTLAALRTLARNISNTLVDQNVTDPELNGYLNHGAGQFDDLLVQANENWRLSSFAITTVTGTDTYPLAADHYVTKGVDALLQNSATPVPVNRFDFQERNKFGIVPLPAAGASPYACGFEYAEWGTNLKLIPGKSLPIIPLTVWYYPKLPTLAADGDTLDVVQNGWEYYPAMRAAVLIKDKQQSDCTVLIGRLAELEKSILARAGRRNQTQPHVMTSSLRGRMFGWMR